MAIRQMTSLTRLVASRARMRGGDHEDHEYPHAGCMLTGGDIASLFTEPVAVTPHHLRAAVGVAVIVATATLTPKRHEAALRGAPAQFDFETGADFAHRRLAGASPYCFTEPAASPDVIRVCSGKNKSSVGSVVSAEPA